MTKDTHKDPWYEGVVSAAAFGGFLIILGVVFGLTPGVPTAIIDFFGDLTGVTYPAINGSIVLPGPGHPADHMALYSAVFNFDIGIAVLQVALLAVRLLVHSRVSKIAETVGNLVFWSVAAVMTTTYLFIGTLSGWFTFWTTIIIFAGVSLVIQFLIRLIAWQSGRRN